MLQRTLNPPDFLSLEKRFCLFLVLGILFLILSSRLATPQFQRAHVCIYVTPRRDGDGRKWGRVGQLRSPASSVPASLGPPHSPLRTNSGPPALLRRVPRTLSADTLSRRVWGLSGLWGALLLRELGSDHSAPPRVG